VSFAEFNRGRRDETKDEKQEERLLKSNINHDGS
jgi:hypothetical protein